MNHDKSPNHAVPSRFAALAAIGVLTLTGCIETPSVHEAPTAQATQTEISPQATASLEDRLERIRDGICGKAGAVATEDCLELPRVTQEAGFSVITETQAIPQAPYDEVDETRKIAEVNRKGSDTESLSPDYKEALVYVMNNPFSKEAVKLGTRIVFEQQEDEQYYGPKYLPQIDAIRMQLFTGVNDAEWASAPEKPSVGEIHAYIVHESSHAVQEKWHKHTEQDEKLDSAYLDELRSAMEWIRIEYGAQIAQKLDTFNDLLEKDLRQGDISKSEYKALRGNSEAISKMLNKRNGFIKFTAEDSEDGPYFQLPAAILVGEDYPYRDDYRDEMKIEAPRVAGEMNDIFREHLAEFFSYGVEHKVMTGLLDKTTMLGHGWDNRGEFIASMTALVEVAPNEMISYVNKLDDTHRKRIVKLLHLIAGKYRSENPLAFEDSNYPVVLEQLSN